MIHKSRYIIQKSYKRLYVKSLSITGVLRNTCYSSTKKYAKQEQTVLIIE